MRNKIFQVSIFTLIVLNAFLFTDLAHSASGGDTWKFQVAPYIWLAGQNGKVATIPPLPPADIDIDFYDDILGNIKGALMLVGEARKGSYGIVADVAYIDIELENSTPGPFFTLLTSRTQSWIVSVAGLYRLIENQESFLDFIGGARYWSVDSNLTLQEGLLSPRSVSNKEDWFDPFIGMKGLAPLGESKFLSQRLPRYWRIWRRL